VWRSEFLAGAQRFWRVVGAGVLAASRRFVGVGVFAWFLEVSRACGAGVVAAVLEVCGGRGIRGASGGLWYVFKEIVAVVAELDWGSWRFVGAGVFAEVLEVCGDRSFSRGLRGSGELWGLEFSRRPGGLWVLEFSRGSLRSRGLVGPELSQRSWRFVGAGVFAGLLEVCGMSLRR
jgi:hypothetical protein